MLVCERKGGEVGSGSHTSRSQFCTIFSFQAKIAVLGVNVACLVADYIILVVKRWLSGPRSKK